MAILFSRAGLVLGQRFLTIELYIKCTNKDILKYHNCSFKIHVKDQNICYTPIIYENENKDG